MHAKIALGPADALPRDLVLRLARQLQNHPNFTVDVHYMHGTPYIFPLEDAARRGQAKLFCYFAGAADRAMVTRGVPIEFVPCAFRDISAAMLAAGVTDLFHMGRTSPTDPEQFSFGSCVGYSLALARKNVQLHLEGSVAHPFTWPIYTREHFKRFVIVTESDAPIHLHKSVSVSEVDLAIASHIVPLLPEFPAIQVGVGGVPNSVLATMVKQGIPVRQIVSELFSPAMIPLMEENLVAQNVECTIAFGDTVEFYKFLNDHAEQLAFDPVEVTNSSERLAEIEKLISINSCLEVDYTGQVNSEEVNNTMYSGAGGQLDFVLGAIRSRGGMSFLCMPSKRVDKATGSIKSRIVERLHGAVTVPRNCVDWIVTEKGAVRLRGLSLNDRRDALLSIA